MEQYLTEPVIREFREQTNNMLAAVALLSRRLRSTAGERELAYLSVLEQGLYRMMRTTFHLELMETKKPAFRPALLDAAGLCRDLGQEVESLLKTLQNPKLVFTWSVEENSILLTADIQLLETALLNLIANAIEHAAEDAKISLRAARRDGWVIFTVRDNGSGLQAPLEPDSDPYRKKPGGLGLGLPVARKIAALHGGSVILQDGGESGVSAALSIPIQKWEPENPHEPPLPTPTFQREYTGGFSKTLVELSFLLPAKVYSPFELE